MAIPHKCPVCEGRGTVPHGFYNSVHYSCTVTAANRETCKTCWGLGIVWEPAREILQPWDVRTDGTGIDCATVIHCG